MAQADR
jgi:hypothetical protein